MHRFNYAEKNTINAHKIKGHSTNYECTNYTLAVILLQYKKADREMRPIYMYECPEKCRESLRLSTPTAIFPKLLTGFSYA